MGRVEVSGSNHQKIRNSWNRVKNPCLGPTFSKPSLKNLCLQFCVLFIANRSSKHTTVEDSKPLLRSPISLSSSPPSLLIFFQKWVLVTLSLSLSLRLITSILWSFPFRYIRWWFKLLQNWRFCSISTAPIVILFCFTFDVFIMFLNLLYSRLHFSSVLFSFTSR